MKEQIAQHKTLLIRDTVRLAVHLADL
jgi:hypothetical protein